MIVSLPPFPAGTEFLDVDGIPVSLGNVPGSPYWVTAWDGKPPRAFDLNSARRKGVAVSEDQFRIAVTGLATTGFRVVRNESRR
jgi:hypothetical protein